MANIHTTIEWTDVTWNPTTGCDKVSPGCKNCYAERLVERFPQSFPQGFRFTLHPERLRQPYRWRKPRRVFVNSMSDLFHEQMPMSFLLEIFKVMRETPQHTYQILTKRHKRLLELDPFIDWPPNVWMGVSVENQKYAERIDFLRQTGAKVKFVSCEPLLGPVELDLRGIDWVIVGGESGPNHRPIDPAWVRSLRDQCQRANVPFFFKQWGGRTSKSGGRLLDGRTWDELPEAHSFAERQRALSRVSFDGIEDPVCDLKSNLVLGMES